MKTYERYCAFLFIGICAFLVSAGVQDMLVEQPAPDVLFDWVHVTDATGAIVEAKLITPYDEDTEYRISKTDSGWYVTVYEEGVEAEDQPSSRVWTELANSEGYVGGLVLITTSIFADKAQTSKRILDKLRP